MLDDERESGAIHIVWTKHKKIRVFTNIYFQSTRNLMETEQSKAVPGYLDLNRKYSGQYIPFDFDTKENARATSCF